MKITDSSRVGTLRALLIWISLNLGFLAVVPEAQCANAFANCGLLTEGRNSRTAKVLANRSWSSAGLLYQPGFAAIREMVGTLLQNGKVMITGSSNGSAQLYDPDTQSSNMTPPGGPQSAHTATLLSNGTVLTIEGYDSIRFNV